MRHKSRNWISRVSPTFVAALITCSAAQGQEVRTNYLPGTDFSKYRTYAWVTIQGAGHPNHILDAEIKESIDSQLRAKGFTKMDSTTDSRNSSDLPHGSDLPPSPPGLTQPPDVPRSADVPNSADLPHADLLIDYQVGINHERQWTAFGTRDGFGWPGMGTAMGTATSSTIEVGTLVLNVYDAAAKRLAWTGTATMTINLSKDQQKNQKNLDKVMQKLLKDFPPRQR
jgi:Domain of unknown function (DUF4136)